MSEPQPPATGAPAALKFLEIEEAELRTAYSARKAELEAAIASQVALPPEKDGTDWAEVVSRAQINFKDAQDLWHKTLKALREFDRQIDPIKRDASEKITRDEGEKVFRNWAISSRGMAQSYITSICQDVFTCKTPADVHKLASERFVSIISSSIADCVREAQLPLWCEQAVKEVL